MTLWKPSDTAILSNYLIYKIFREAGFPEGLVNFLPSDGPVFGKGGAVVFAPTSLPKGEKEGFAVAPGAVPVVTILPICVRGAGIFNPDAVVFSSFKLPPKLPPPIDTPPKPV